MIGQQKMILTGLLPCMLAGPLFAESLEASRQLLRESLEVQRSFHKEKEVWDSERQILEHQIQQYQLRKKELEQQLAVLKEKQIKLEREQSEIKSWTQAQQQWLDNIETEISALDKDPLYRWQELPASIAQQLGNNPELSTPISVVAALQKLLQKQVAWATHHGESTSQEEEIKWQEKILTLKVLHLGEALLYCDFEGQLLWRSSTSIWKTLGPTPPQWHDIIESVAGKQANALLNLPIPKEVL